MDARRVAVVIAVVGAALGCGDINVSDGQDPGKQPDLPGIDAQDDTEGRRTCAFGDDAACDDGDSCTLDRCNAKNECVHTALLDVCKIDGECYADGAPSPLNACLVCRRSESLTAWSAVQCDDGLPCTLDECDPESGCFAVADDTLPCDDGQPCTTDDRCLAGACVATPCACAQDADCAGAITVPACQRAACVDAACVAVPDASVEGAACEDGDPCTVGDVCVAGACTGAPMDCSAWDGPCASGACQAGACVLTLAAPGSACQDAAGCLVDGACTAAGNCEGTWDVAQCGCADDGDCDDGLGCTTDRCDVTRGACVREVDAGACKLLEACFAEGAAHPLDACLVCEPAAAATAWTAVSCDDGDPCTVDVCAPQGGCQSSPTGEACCKDARDCADAGVVAGPCQAVDCQSGACVVVADPQADGSACDDGDACTHADQCVQGACVGSPVSCEGEAPACAALTCDPMSGACLPAPLEAGVGCDDGDPCTIEDACDGAGACLGTPKDCSGLDGACTLGTCDGATGACLAAARVGQACDDGQACTLDDTCSADGTCLGTWDAAGCGCVDDTPCAGLSDACNTGRCDTETHACYKEPKAGACDDGNPCTHGDQCAGGACVGIAYGCDDGRSCTADACNGDDTCTHALLPGRCLIDGVCWDAGVARPGNPCQSCQPGASTSAWSPTSASCDDGDPCTFGDQCTAGACAGAAYTCDDGLACTTDACLGDGSCDFALQPGRCLIDGACVEAGAKHPTNPCLGCAPAASTTAWSPVSGACDDGNPCTWGDQCAAGACGGTAYACDDGKACTLDLCVGDGSCSHPVQPGFCLVGGVCYAAGAFNPANACQICDPAVSPLTFTQHAAACDDGDPCTWGDQCANGSCGGTAYGCDDGLSCTTDACDGAGGCSNVLNPGSCLIGGVCYPAGATNPSNPCQSCVPGSTTSAWTNNADACDDGNPCTHGDTCSAGACGGTPYTCNDGNPCTSDACDGAGGCTFTANSAPCDDGNPCTESDTCSGGACSGTPRSCDDGLWCTTDSCSGGTCEHEIVDNACLIGGTCYSHFDTPGPGTCLYCDPLLSQTFWSENPFCCSWGTFCTKHTDCPMGSCDIITNTCNCILR